MKKLLAVIILGSLSYSVQAQCGKCPHHNNQTNCTKAQTEATQTKKSTDCSADTKDASKAKAATDTKSQKAGNQKTVKAKEAPKEEPKSNNNTTSQPATTPANTNSNQGGRAVITPKQ